MACGEDIAAAGAGAKIGCAGWGQEGRREGPGNTQHARHQRKHAKMPHSQPGPGGGFTSHARIRPGDRGVHGLPGEPPDLGSHRKLPRLPSHQSQVSTSPSISPEARAGIFTELCKAS